MGRIGKNNKERNWKRRGEGEGENAKTGTIFPLKTTDDSQKY